MKINNEEFQIKRLGKQDVLIFKNLIQLFQEVFEMENPETTTKSYLENLLEKSDFVVYVIIRANEVVGGLTAYELPLYYSADSEIFLYDIAIKSEHQRKGLGQRLLSVLNEYCKENGIKEFFVAAHETDKHALAFYKSTGGKAEKVVHFNYKIN